MVVFVRHLLLAVFAIAGCARAPKTATPEADLVIKNAAVLTMDAHHPHARAIAVRGGVIVEVSDDDAATLARFPGARVIDARGGTVVPALTDAHAHLYGLGRALDEVDLTSCRSPDACAERVRSSPNVSKTEGWIEGRGWDQNLFPTGAFPEHAALDKVTSDKPVWLRRVDGHAGWANQRALELAGITRKTPDPQGGKILRGPSGEPTGVLVDNAMDLVGRVIPPPSPSARERAIRNAQAIALGRGLTEVHEMGIDDETIAAFRRLDERGELKIRVYAYKSAEAKSPKVVGSPRSRFVLRGIKMYADGALGSRGAALLEPYSDDPGNVGLLVTEPKAIQEAASRAVVDGWQLAVHAIGDRANRGVLEAFERAGVRPGHQFRVEHAQVIAPEDVERFRSMSVVASMQPTHATSDMGWAEERLGPKRIEGAYAWRTLLDAGVHIACGSDAPVEDIDPRTGFHAATTRSPSQPVGAFHPEQRMTFDETMRCFTIEAARAAFEEEWRGRAAVGLAADLTVFDRDLELAARRGALMDAEVRSTIVGGEIVYAR